MRGGQFLPLGAASGQKVGGCCVGEQMHSLIVDDSWACNRRPKEKRDNKGRRRRRRVWPAGGFGLVGRLWSFAISDPDIRSKPGCRGAEKL